MCVDDARDTDDLDALTGPWLVAYLGCLVVMWMGQSMKLLARRFWIAVMDATLAFLALVVLAFLVVAACWGPELPPP